MICRPIRRTPAVTAQFIPSRVIDWGTAQTPATPLAWLQPFPVALRSIVAAVQKPVSNDTAISYRETRRIDWFYQNTTLNIFAGSRPVNQYDWPLPTQQARLALTWTQGPTPEIAVVRRADGPAEGPAAPRGRPHIAAGMSAAGRS
jgi:hypothetical protein